MHSLFNTHNHNQGHRLIRSSVHWIILGISFNLLLTSCYVRSGKNIRVERIASDTQMDLSGKWNDTDARVVSEALIEDSFNAGWLNQFIDKQGRRPAIRMRSVVNRTDEHIDAQVFIKNIERSMINSGRVKVLAQSGSELDTITREQKRSLSGHQSDQSAVSVGNEIGADFVVSIRLSAILDQIAGRKTKFYKVNMELIHSSTGEKVWIGDHEIKKVVSQASVTW